MMPLLYIGITQASVPVGIRERIHADDARCRKIARASSGFSDGALILSTCERFEAYSTSRHADANRWIELLAREFGFSTDALSAHAHIRFGEDVARQLIRVGAGLDSRLLGEPQILRQLRTAYLAGLEHRELNAVLSALGRTAIHAGKRVRRDTALPAAGRSIIDLSLERLIGGGKPSTHSRIVVLGTGALAREALAHLTHLPARSVAIVSRSYDRAKLLADRFGAIPYALSDLSHALSRASAMLACTSAAEGFVVTRSNISARRRKTLRIVDLGMPRNVDPDLAANRVVELVHLENMHAFDHAPDSAVTAAGAIVERQLARFQEWLAGRSVAQQIAALHATDSNKDRQMLHKRIARIKAQVAA